MNLSKEWYKNEFMTQEMIETHRKIETEFSFYDAVAEGNLEYVEKNCKEHEFTNLEGVGVLSKDPLQNLRYHFVVTTAMVTRYCIHAGMEQDKAYNMSDFYISKMDGLYSISEISILHDTMVMDFCKQMNALRSSQVLSKPIVLCIDYIYSHLHYRITISELAEYLNLSESYLSKLFKKEMGMPVSQYILELKIEKAKNLLQYSDYNMIQIASYLSFSSQSHFIQCFEKQVGVTPHKYRMKNFRSNWDKMPMP